MRVGDLMVWHRGGSVPKTVETAEGLGTDKAATQRQLTEKYVSSSAAEVRQVT